jgi:coproporphyrinogen III oxidase-like Fe-S oxidoreductase
MMGLRLAEGLAVEAVPPEKLMSSMSYADGLLRIEGGRVHATAEGRLVLNRITGALLA